ELWRTLETARADKARNDAEAHLQGFVTREWCRLEQDWQRFKAIAQRCRDEQPPLVITHGDWPFNLLQSENIYLVDWDEVLLAPAERDLWFPQREAAFDRGYQAKAHNELATSFYVYNRYFDDLLWSARAVLTGTVPVQHSPLTFFDNVWMDGLR